MQLSILLGAVLAQNACLLANKGRAPKSPVVTPANVPNTPPATPPPSQPAGPVQRGRLTHYTFGPRGIAFCDAKHYGDNEHIVALSTSFMNGRGNCDRRIRLTVEGRSIVCRVVDMCNEAHGCIPGTVDGTPGVWRTLGLNMDRGVINGVEWHFI
jgi:hypothetical protein